MHRALGTHTHPKLTSQPQPHRAQSKLDVQLTATCNVTSSRDGVTGDMHASLHVCCTESLPNGVEDKYECGADGNGYFELPCKAFPKHRAGVASDMHASLQVYCHAPLWNGLESSMSVGLSAMGILSYLPKASPIRQSWCSWGQAEGPLDSHASRNKGRAVGTMMANVTLHLCNALRDRRSRWLPCSVMKSSQRGVQALQTARIV